MFKFVAILIVCCFAFPSYAQETVNYDVHTLYAMTCEKIEGSENKSEARNRATDKASFAAIEKLTSLSKYKRKYDEHDYNILVYKLVDNYLEDLTVRTLKQDENEVCVEITGYINDKNIIKTITELRQKQQANYPQKLALEEESMSEPAVEAFPPKPSIKINDKIAVENMLEDEITVPHKDEKSMAYISSAKIFVERTKFQNNTSTNAFAQEIMTELKKYANVIIAPSASEADYTIKSEVLRAKVDKINKQTNRLQMVTAMELINNEDGKSVVEHQNRFILFESSENEQEVAIALLKKILRKSTKMIASNIKNATDKNNSFIITPPQN